MMGEMLADLRFAGRSLARRPWMTALTAVTLAMGLAANAAIFSVVNALVLRPLKFAGVDRLVRAWETAPHADAYDLGNVAPANFLDWKQGAAGSLDALVALDWWDANVRGRELPERVQGFFVSPEFFATLGVVPELGRGFRPDEAAEAQRRVVVLGHDLWQRSFGARADVVGQDVVIDGGAYTVVGVAPPHFSFPEGAEVWAPLMLAPVAGAARDQHRLTVIGRLAPGHVVSDARTALLVVASRLEREHVDTNARRGVEVASLQRGYEDPAIRGVLAIWQASAVCLLLIACLNVANLSLARGAERQQELAVRLALGAPRARLVRQLLTEGLVLASASAALALPLVELAVRELRDRMPAEVARFITGWAQLGIDRNVLLFTALLAFAAVLVANAWPALRASKPDLVDSLKESGRSSSVGTRGQRGRNALVVAEVAAALTLLVGAALAVRGTRHVLAGPHGYDPDHLLTLRAALPEARYPDAESRRGYAGTALERLAELPDVEHAAVANVLPGRGSNASRAVWVEGEPEPPASDPPAAEMRAVSPGYFAALKLPLVAGRILDDGDRPEAEPVVVVSHSMAQRFFPGRDPLGQRFRAGDARSPLLRVVGVCGDVIHHWYGSRNVPTFYVPFAQAPTQDLAFALRTRGQPEALAASARRALAAVDPYQPSYDVLSQHAALVRSLIGLEYGASIMGVFGVLALVLALSGVYAVMAYRVSLREEEFGVRMALGASRLDLFRLTLAQAARLSLVGVVIGLALGSALVRAMDAIFAGVVPINVPTLLMAATLLAACALSAAGLAAARAAGVDPVRLLRAG